MIQQLFLEISEKAEDSKVAVIISQVFKHTGCVAGCGNMLPGSTCLRMYAPYVVRNKCMPGPGAGRPGSSTLRGWDTHGGCEVADPSLGWRVCGKYGTRVAGQPPGALHMASTPLLDQRRSGPHSVVAWGLGQSRSRIEQPKMECCSTQPCTTSSMLASTFGRFQATQHTHVSSPADSSIGSKRLNRLATPCTMSLHNQAGAHHIALHV
jgi:hypothetical protein